jgi:hypothetical protein
MPYPARWSHGFPMRACLLITAVLAAATSAWGATGDLTLTAVDGQGGKPVACRVHLKNQAGRPVIPRKVPSLQDHFVLPGTIKLSLPLGHYSFQIERGLEYPTIFGHFEIQQYASDSKTVELKRGIAMSDNGWYAGDLDVRRDPADMELLLQAEDLYVAQTVTWWNEKNLAAGKKLPDKRLLAGPGQRYCQWMAGGVSRPGGSLLMFHQAQPLAASAADGEFPPLMALAAKAHDAPGAWVDATRPYWWDLPTLVALGQVDSIQMLYPAIGRDRVTADDKDGFARDASRYPEPRGNPMWAETIYFHLLNCGLRIPPSASSGSGLTGNPPGSNRMYVHVDGGMNYQKWWESFRAGRVVITNGPLLQPSVLGQLPGHTFQGQQGKPLEFEIGLTLSIREPLSYLDIVKDGRVLHSIPFAEYSKSGRLPKVEFTHSGWFLVRGVTDHAKTYRMGMTAPYFVEFGYQPRISKASAQFFLDWVYQRARQLSIADPQQRQPVIELHRKARDFWQGILAKANAE